MKIKLLASVVLLLTQVCSWATTYYVSKSGSDSNSGTSIGNAFLTIQKAATVMNSGDTCYILSGTYRENITPAHSGTSASPITFAAYPGQTPVVSGAEVLNTSWTVYTNYIYQTTVSTAFNQLFVDGAMMNLARWPNAAVDDLLHAPRSTPTVCTLTNLTDPALPNVNLLGAMLHIFPNEFGNPGFTANTRYITNWNSATKSLSWSNNISGSGAAGTYYYVYGVLPLLDIATEWYLSTNNTLYLWTANSNSPASHLVEYKARTNAFTLDNRSYVTVQGIWVFGAGISMQHTTNCVVDSCNLIYVQHNTLADYTKLVPIANMVSGQGSVWKNSSVLFSSQDGIQCAGQNEMVTNCTIFGVDYYPGFYYASVTAGGGGSGTKILGNTLSESGRYLVGVQAPGCEVAYNDLGYGEMLTSDGGATYEFVSGGNGGGTTIHHNWAHDSWAGIYVDANQNNYAVYRNVCFSNYVGMLFNQFTNNVIVNNTCVSNTFLDMEFNGLADTDVDLVNNIWRTNRNYYSGTVFATNNGWFPPLNSNFVPGTGSGAIDTGFLYPPYTDGYVGSKPDIGAYEVGGTYWTPGSTTPLPTWDAPVITSGPTPSSQTKNTGSFATFAITANSTPQPSYQWQAGATGSGTYTNLSNGGQFSGVLADTLTISNLTSGNAGDYVVVVSNPFGSVTSTYGRLTVTTNSSGGYYSTVLSDHPTSYWPLNETSGTVIHDLVGTNNGTAINTTGLIFGNPGVLYSNYSSDTAIYFLNTNSGYINVPYSATLNTPRFTVEAWMNMPTFPVTGAGANMNPISFVNAPAPWGWAFEIPSPNGANPHMDGWMANAGWKSADSGVCIQNKWAYYALTYDGTSVSIYTNGVLAKSVASSGYSQVSAGNPLLIGAYYDSGTADRFYKGAMAKVAVYTNALSSTRVLAHWQAGTNAP